VLKGESRADYERLLNDLRGSLQPVGGLEDLLVQRLATIAWRLFGYSSSKAGRLQIGQDFIDCDQRDGAKGMLPFNGLVEGPLIERIENPVDLERCLELLAVLKWHLKRRGFDENFDPICLKEIYGQPSGSRFPGGLYEYYDVWVHTSKLSEEERAGAHYPSAASYKKSVIQLIEKEISRLTDYTDYKEEQSAIHEKRRPLDKQIRSIPDPEVFERLMRYKQPSIVSSNKS
jgi:hypothetical protein